MATRRGRKKTQGKFIARRLFLMLLTIGLVGTVGWLVWSRLLSPAQEPAEPESQSLAESLPEPSEPEASEPEPEPSEPEEEPVVANPDDAWQLIMASAVSPLPEGYAPPQLDTVAGYQVDSRIASALKQMIAEAKLEGINLQICSAYRSEDYQRELHSNKIQEHMAYGYSEDAAVAAASSIVLPPGTSEHQTGLALDIVTPDYQVLDDGYAETPAAKWLAANAWKYGFILRYPQDKQEITDIIFEPWHYRYVGEEHAKAIYDGSYCLEEYLYGVLNQQRMEAFVSASQAASQEEPPENETQTSGEE